MFSSLNFEPVNCAYPIIKETIPKSSLGYNTNNKYPEFPPLMNDGRSITASYQPEAVTNEELKNVIGIKSNWEYRKYLTDNSKEIMEHNFREACNDVGYIKRHTDTPMNRIDNFSSASSPYLFNSVMDNSTPFGYVSSDLKSIYLTREQLDARRIAPVVNSGK